MLRCSSCRCRRIFRTCLTWRALLDGIPRERRLVVDLWGRFNDTIRLEHDFNHLEKMDGHAGLGVGGRHSARSPTPSCSRRWLRCAPTCGSFLFHGYDPGSVVKPRIRPPREAAAGMERQALRRDVRRQQLAALGAGAPIPRRLRAGPRTGRQGMPRRLGLGRAAASGRWRKASWASTRIPAFLAELGVEFRDGVRFDEVVGLLGQGPVCAGLPPAAVPAPRAS